MCCAMWVLACQMVGRTKSEIVVAVSAGVCRAVSKAMHQCREVVRVLRGALCQQHVVDLIPQTAHSDVRCTWRRGQAHCGGDPALPGAIVRACPLRDRLGRPRVRPVFTYHACSHIMCVHISCVFTHAGAAGTPAPSAVRSSSPTAIARKECMTSVAAQIPPGGFGEPQTACMRAPRRGLDGDMAPSLCVVCASLFADDGRFPINATTETCSLARSHQRSEHGRDQGGGGRVAHCLGRRRRTVSRGSAACPGSHPCCCRGRNRGSGLRPAGRRRS